MNAHRKSDGDGTSPEKTVEELMRASAKAMEMAMKGEWTKDVGAPSAPINPLMAHPTAMMAAATVMGMGVSSQIAGMWLGFMKGFAEKSGDAEDVGGDSVGKPMPQSDAATKPATPKKPRRKIAVVVDNAKPKTVVAAPAGSDDLKRISGIGPKLAAVLEEKGIADFASLASLDAKAVAKLDAELGLEGRILRDDWIGQAKALMEAG